MEQYRSHVAPQLFLVRGFLDPRQCLEIRAAMDRGIPEAAEVLGGAMAARPDVRRTTSIEVDAGTLARVERLLDAQVPTLEAFFDVALSGREGSGFLRYGDGGFYRPHRDRADDEAWPGASRRAVTLIVFLNDEGFAGGVLRVGGVDVPPAAGTLVAFPAGELHEVTLVSGGHRDAIVDWCLTRPRPGE